MSYNEIGIVITIVAVAAVVAWRLFLQKKKPVYTFGMTIPERFPFTFDTPGGVRVRSVVKVPIAQQRLIDAGIQTQIDKSSLVWPMWGYRSLHDYSLMFIDPMAINQENEPGSPALIVDGIQTAGTNLGIGGNNYPTPTIVLPHQAPMGWRFTDYLLNCARHESEHLREWICDKSVFYSHVYPNPDIHPVYE